MKFLLVSDTHSKTAPVVEWIEENKDLKIDLIIHLGDYDSDGDEIEKLTGIETRSVLGNNDYDRNSRPLTINLEACGHKILATHGHKYGVPYNFQRLYLLAKQEEADLVLFGHSHEFLFEEEDGIYFINPGSPSFPRGDGKKSIAILDLDQDGRMNLERILFEK